MRLAAVLVVASVFCGAVFAQPAADKTGTSANVLSLPAGPGSIEGLGKSFQPLLNTGSATYSVPLELPPGANGFAPAISLAYDSGYGNSAAGQGWALIAALSIERQTSKGFPRYRDSDTPSEHRDVFVFRGEEIVPLSDRSYRLKNDEEFRRFQPVAAEVGGPITSWLVEDRNGTRHWLGRYYGEGPGARRSRVMHPFPDSGLGDRTAFELTYQWLEDAAEDVNGNRIEFDYAADSESPGVLYLAAARYFARGTVDAYQIVAFFTEPRADRLNDNQAGFSRQTARRYREIATGSYYEGTIHTVRSYVLSYRPEDMVLGNLVASLSPAERPVDLGVSRIASVTRYGSDREWGGTGAPGTPLPPTRFGYSGFFLTPFTGPLREALLPLQVRRMPYELDPLMTGPMRSRLQQDRVTGGASPIFDTPLESPEVQFVDLNGDGLPDILDTRTGSLKPHYTVALNRGEGSFGPSQSISHPPGIDLSQSTPGANEVLLADMDGNGTADLVQILGSSSNRTTRVFANRAASAPGQLGFNAAPGTEAQSPPDISMLDADARIADLNFDKRPDVLITDAFGIRGIAATETGGWRSLGAQRWSQSTVGTGVPDSYRFSIITGSSRMANPLVQLADMNGDRLPDLVRVVIRQSGIAEVRYRPLTGPMLWGKERTLEFALPDGSPSGVPAELRVPGVSTSPDRSWESIRIFDVNGDGLADVVYVGRNRSVTYYLNCSGVAVAGPFLIRDTPIYAPDDAGNPTILRVSDVDGDGSNDLIFYHATGDSDRRGFQFVKFLTGQKAGLLQTIDNGIGLRTWIRYKPTTSDLVRAERAGHPWATVSPIPNWAVAAVIDDIGLDLNQDGRQDIHVTTVAYRDAFYDGIQKQFRGFAFVETVEWGDDVDEAGLPRASPGLAAQATSVTRYRYLTGAPDKIDNDEYIDGFDTEPRPVAATVDETSDLGGHEEEALKGKQVLRETSHGALLRDGAAGFDLLASQAAAAASAEGPYSPAALRCTPDTYTFERRVDHWNVRRLYRPAGATAPKGRLLRTTTEWVSLPEVSVSCPVHRQSTVELIEANRLMHDSFTDAKAEFPLAAPKATRTDFDYDDYGNEILKHEFGIVGLNNAEGKEARLQRTVYVMPGTVAGRVQPWIIDRPYSRRVEGTNGTFASEERFYYDGDELLGLPLGQIGTRGLLKRRQKRQFDSNSPPSALDRIPQTTTDVAWISNPGDPRPDAVEWVDVDKYAHDAFGNKLIIMDGLGRIDPNGNPVFDAGHFTQVSFDPLFHALPIREERVVGGGHGSLLFEAGYLMSGTAASAGLHWGFGLPVYYLDPNGNRTDFRYDRHGRLTAIVRPGDTENIPTTVFTYRPGDPHRGLIYEYDRAGTLTMTRVPSTEAANSVQTDQRARSGSPDIISHFSFTAGDGNEVLVLQQGEGGSYYAMTARRYGARGSVIFEAQPFIQTGLAFHVPASGTEGTDFFRDPLGRVIRTRLPAESTGAAGRRLETRVQNLPFEERHLDAEDLANALGKPDHSGTPTIRHFDGLGRLESIAETAKRNGALEIWLTQYGYDPNDQLTWLLDSQSNLRWTRFDGLGRAIALFGLNRGPVFHRYDLAGNLVETTDAKAQRIVYSYDGLNRLASERYLTGSANSPRPQSAADVVYEYDGTHGTIDVNGQSKLPANPKGYLTSVSDTSGEEHNSYDSRGRLSWTAKRIRLPGTQADATTLTGLEYDSMDRVRRIVYPDGSAIDYSFDARGKTKAIAGSFGTIIADRTYTAVGQRERTTFGNGIIAEHKYDPRLRFASIVVRIPGRAAPLLDYSYSYDGASNLVATKDNRPTTEIGSQDSRRNDQTFTYDDAYRLVHVTYPGSELSFAYDRLGNMLGETPTRALRKMPAAPAPAVASRYGGTRGTSNRIARDGNQPGPHALRYDAAGHSLSYDLNGNLETAGDLKLTWDVKDRLTAAETPAFRVEYNYDYTGRRVLKSVSHLSPDTRGPPVVTRYPDRHFEVVDNAPVRYVFDGETRIARIDSHGNRIFYHGDELGSATLITADTGVVIEENAFYPFGALRNQFRTGSARTDLPEYLFIQKEYSADLGLADFEARQLVSVLGRFAAIDPVSSRLPSAALINPQTLNEYAYAANSPLKFTDSSGKWIETAWDLASLGLSIRAVREDPSPLNIASVVVDAAAVALPLVPGGAGVAIKGGRAVKAEVEVAAAVTETTAAARIATRAEAGTAAVVTTQSAGRSLVYRSFDEAGRVNYVGMTTSFERRAEVHWAQKGIRIQAIPGIANLSVKDARAVEQVLIERYGLARDGGTLLNKINSISPTNPIYKEAKIRGEDLLRNIP
ncbi:MAG: VCBS repeat-containing protein [Bryobacterales bacterium]|nr:VCBS repeat-containing protein [Bryobacterales bacterium]